MAVVLRTADSRLLIADAAVNLRRFDFTTTAILPVGKASIVYTHCCQSAMCPRQCGTCNGPYFSCDVITCTEVQCID